MGFGEFISLFGEAGLVVILMAIAVWVIARAYSREKKSKEVMAESHKNEIVDMQKTQVETLINFTTTMDGIKDRLHSIEQKI